MDRRRTSVPFDLYFFEKQQRDTFERIYATNLTNGYHAQRALLLRADCPLSGDAG